MTHKLTITGTAPLARVEIDGQQVVVTAVDLHVDATSPPRATVHPDVIDADACLEAEITIPEHTARALIALGWTPPQVTA